MSELYTKLAQKIVYSSMWGEDGDTCKVWVTILALKDHRTGILDKNPTGIARIANLPYEVVDRAFNKFMSPDPLSTSPEHEGRRLEKVPEGYRVLNHEKYLEYGWSEEKKKYERDRKAEYRSKKAKKTEKPERVRSEPPASKPETIRIPDNLCTDRFKATWAKWMAHLIEKKKKPTSHAVELQLKKLSEMGEARAIAAIEHSISKDWQGIYEPSSGGYSNGGSIKPNDRNENCNSKQLGQYEGSGTLEWREAKRRKEMEKAAQLKLEQPTPTQQEN